MRQFGLTGYPLEHSFSAKYFSDKFSSQNITDCEYLNFPLEKASDIRGLFENDHILCGLNVTIPHKKTIIEYLDVIDPSASEIGSVNVIKAYRKGDSLTLKGFNTDMTGFLNSLPADISERGGVALVLGSGGAANSVAYALKLLGFETLIISRDRKPGTLTYEGIGESLYKEASLIINTTPLGMFPDTSSSPKIDYTKLSSSTFFYDLVYNPAITFFMSEGTKRGCRVMNGLKMLELQAEKAWEIWNDDSV